MKTRLLVAAVARAAGLAQAQQVPMGAASHLAQMRFDQIAGQTVGQMVGQMVGIETAYVSFKGAGAAVTALSGQRVKAEWGWRWRWRRAPTSPRRVWRWGSC